MFDERWYIYSALLGILFGVIITFISFIAAKPYIATRVVYDRAEECKKAGGDYSLYSSDDWFNERCEIKKDLFK